MSTEKMDDQQRTRKLRDLIDKYWCLAYAEGKENRTHDTEEGDAQRVSIAIDKAITALSAAPEGYVLVPVEPTEAMIDGFWGKIQHGDHERAAAEDAWRDALAARPQGVK